ncbi:MAG TPA: hypothetical protein PK959_16060 [Candidatus Competibacteraceae bacterium]|nr:hypothetical protein [Candidatus Competibacteraceae bacterium]
MATLLRIPGLSLTVVFSPGAVVDAMYAAVAHRMAEISTLGM